MRTFFLLTFFSFLVSAFPNTTDTISTKMAYPVLARENWKNFVAKLNNPESEVRIAFLGDSITEKNFTTRGKSNYVDYLSCYFIARNPRTTVKNSGKSGETTSGALTRLQEEILTFKPDLTFVMLGINDSSSWVKITLAEYKKNLEEIILRLLTQNSAVIVLTQNEFLDNPYDGKVKFTDYEKYENSAVEIAERLKVKVINNFSHWQRLKQQQPEKFKSYMYDAIHPNEEGHIFFYSLIRKELDAVLKIKGEQWEFGAWVLFGLCGQALFFSRFLIQWLVSERQKKSIIPISFWYLSLFGSIIVLIYAIQEKDIVFTLAMVFGFTVYTRNLILIYREKWKKKLSAEI